MASEMSPSWLFPALSCALAVLAWAASMFLFYVLTGRIRKLSAHFADKDDVASELGRIQAELSETRAALREMQESRTALAERASEAGAINMTPHGQVLRLHRRGESAAAISSALQVPVGEVNLIVKVYEMSQRRDPEGAVSRINVTNLSKAFPAVQKREIAL
jgi:hypothetical protein